MRRAPELDVTQHRHPGADHASEPVGKCQKGVWTDVPCENDAVPCHAPSKSPSILSSFCKSCQNKLLVPKKYVRALDESEWKNYQKIGQTWIGHTDGGGQFLLLAYQKSASQRYVEHGILISNSPLPEGEQGRGLDDYIGSDGCVQLTKNTTAYTFVIVKPIVEVRVTSIGPASQQLPVPALPGAVPPDVPSDPPAVSGRAAGDGQDSNPSDDAPVGPAEQGSSPSPTGEVSHAGGAHWRASHSPTGIVPARDDAARRDGSPSTTLSTASGSQGVEVRAVLQDNAIEVLCKYVGNLKSASPALRDDRFVMLDAVESVVEYSPEALRDSRLRRSHGSALQYASSRFRKDRDVVLKEMRRSHGGAVPPDVPSDHPAVSGRAAGDGQDSNPSDDAPLGSAEQGSSPRSASHNGQSGGGDGAGAGVGGGDDCAGGGVGGGDDCAGGGVGGGDDCAGGGVGGGGGALSPTSEPVSCQSHDLSETDGSFFDGLLALLEPQPAVEIHSKLEANSIEVLCNCLGIPEAAKVLAENKCSGFHGFRWLLTNQDEAMRDLEDKLNDAALRSLQSWLKNANELAEVAHKAVTAHKDAAPKRRRVMPGEILMAGYESMLEMLLTSCDSPEFGIRMLPVGCRVTLRLKGVLPEDRQDRKEIIDEIRGALDGEVGPLSGVSLFSGSIILVFTCQLSPDGQLPDSLVAVANSGRLGKYRVIDFDDGSPGVRMDGFAVSFLVSEEIAQALWRMNTYHSLDMRFPANFRERPFSLAAAATAVSGTLRARFSGGGEASRDLGAESDLGKLSDLDDFEVAKFNGCAAGPSNAEFTEPLHPGVDRSAACQAPTKKAMLPSQLASADRKMKDRIIRLKIGYCDLQRASEELRGDREIVLATMRHQGHALLHASEELRADREIVLTAVKQNGSALEHASAGLRGDREIVMAAVRQYGRALQYASEELRRDREIVLAAVRQQGHALQHASEELRADREMVLTAVKQNGSALEHASAGLRGDREIMLAVVRQDGRALQYASKKLRGDHEIVLIAVEKGFALQLASEELRADREIVMAAVRQDGRALEFASKELRGDRATVLAAIQQDYRGLQHASQELRGDREIVLAMIKLDYRVLQYASDELRGDRAIVLAAIQQDYRGLQHASEELRADREIVLAAVRQDDSALLYASEKLRRDRANVLAAARQDGSALLSASEELRAD